MTKKLLFFALIALTLGSCKNTQYKDGMTIAKMDETTIYTTEGSEIPLHPEGYEGAATVFLVRHAEAAQNTGTDNPGLTDDGAARAERLAVLLYPIGVDEVIMSDRRRAIFTARPLAMEYNLPVFTYNLEQIDRVIDRVKTKHAGKNIAIYGHSNTTPMVINGITGNSNATDIPHDQYDNLYVVHYKEGVEPLVYQFKY